MPNKYTFKSKDFEVSFLSVADAEKIKPKNTLALISLTDPESHPYISYAKWKFHIRLEFEDVSSQDDGVVFTTDMAKNLIDFALSMPDSVTHIIIHCIQGVSRSGAVTKFLTKHIFKDCFNQAFDKDYVYYNRFVYRTLCRVWKKRTAPTKQIVKPL